MSKNPFRIFASAVCAALAFFASGVRAADTWYVATEADGGNDTTGDGSQAAPFASLTNAVEQAQNGDSIIIAAGTYQPTERIVITKALEIIGDDTDPSQVKFDGQSKYLLLAVSNDGILIHGITFQNGYDNSGSATALSDWPDNYYKGAPIEINAGTISNCVIKSGRGKFNGSMAAWGTAKIYDCFFSGGYNSDGNAYNAGRGGCLKLGGSAVAGRCVFTGGSSGGGGGVGIQGNALLFDSVITNNTARASNYGGGGVYFKNGGTISNGVVKANSASGGIGGGLLLWEGSARAYNTLVAGNSAQNGGGVYFRNANGRLYNCTVAGNAASSIGNNIFREVAAQTVNTIVAGGIHSTSGTDTNGYFGDDPGFLDAANGDYSLDASSICIDAGSTLAYAADATDVSLSKLRVIDGDGDGIATIDIGAYEYDPATAPVGSSFRAGIPDIAAYPMSVSFTPALSGTYGEVTSVSWNFGDSATDSGEVLSDTSHSYASSGSYTITLTVETTLGGTLTATKTILLKGTEAYVSTTGSNTAPYSTPATAARSLSDALSYVGTPATGRAVVHVADGTYKPLAGTTLNTPVEIVGNDEDPSQVVFDGQAKYKFLSIGNANAFIHGITFYRGQGNANAVLSGYPNFFQGCSLEMNSGILSNCVVKSGTSSYAGNLSAWGTAKIYDCVFSGGYNSDGNAQNAARGGNIKIAGNAVAGRCTITGGNAVCGGGATVEGSALLFDSVITNNTSRSNNNYAGGGGVNIQGSGTVSNCVISANTAEHTSSALSGDTAKGGGGVRIMGGKLFGCLVYGNTSRDGAGVMQVGGTVASCTIADNTATANNGYYQAGGTAINTISADLHAGGTVTYSCSPDLTGGTDGNINIADVSLYFRDVSENDYSLKASSPCIDAGSTPDGAEGGFDLAGNARVLDGDNDGTSAIDIGCYEYDPAAIGTQVSFNFSIVRYEAFADTRVVFEPSIEGQYGEVQSVAWDFGDGQSSSPAELLSATNDYASAGTYTVTLTVATTLGGELVSSREVSFLPLVTYVAEDGSATAPYDTAAKATSSIADAIAALGTPLSGAAKVVVADGEYAAPTSRIIVSAAVEIAGNDAGRSAVVFDGGTTKGFFLLDNALSSIHGITFRNGFQTDYSTLYAGSYSSAPLEARQGVISNCVIDACEAKYAGGVTVWNTGKLFDSIVANCSNQDGNGSIAGKGGGLKVYGSAVVSGCVITNCTAVNGGGAALFGGTIDHCVFFANKTKGSTGPEGGAGIYIDSNSPVVRNCLVYGNEAVSGTRNGGGIRCKASGAVIENCTIADNTAATSADGLYMTAGTLRNSIVLGSGEYDSENPPLVATGGTVEYCCSPSLADGTSGNISSAPVFKDRSNGDYTVKGSSPTVNAGVNEDWMTTALDLAGATRILNRTVDMGCYETEKASTTFIMVR